MPPLRWCVAAECSTRPKPISTPQEPHTSGRGASLAVGTATIHRVFAPCRQAASAMVESSKFLALSTPDRRKVSLNKRNNWRFNCRIGNHRECQHNPQVRHRPSIVGPKFISPTAERRTFDTRSRGSRRSSFPWPGPWFRSSKETDWRNHIAARGQYVLAGDRPHIERSRETDRH